MYRRSKLTFPKHHRLREDRISWLARSVAWHLPARTYQPSAKPLDDAFHIISWRGADIQYIRRFARDFPNAALIRLERNFQSTSHILDAANAVIAQDKTRLGKTLFTRKPIGDRIEVVAFRNAEAEATGLVAEMKRRHAEGLSWSDMALLYRSNALSRGFEEALMRARVPYVLVGDVGFYH